MEFVAPDGPRDSLFMKYRWYCASMLHLAIETGQLAVARSLLEHDAIMPVNDPYSPLAVAAIRGDISAIELLLNYEFGRFWLCVEPCKGYTWKRYEYTCLEVAASTGNLQLFKLLLQQDTLPGALSSNGFRKCLPAASHSGSPELVKLLLSEGANVNDESTAGDLPLEMACESKNLELVRLLLSLEADPNRSTRARVLRKTPTPIQIAAKRGDTVLIELLLEHGANTNAPSFFFHNGDCGGVIVSTPQVAMLSSNRNAAEILIQAGTALTNTASEGEYPPYPKTALQIACESGWVEIVRLCIQSGANINEPPIGSSSGSAALMSAMKSRNHGLITYILRQGARVNVFPINKGLPTPLQIAIENAGFEMMLHFIELGADVEDSGALWLAVKKNDIESVAFLLGHNPAQTCNSHRTLCTRDPSYGQAALTQAVRDKNHAMLRMLLANGIGVSPIPPAKMSSHVSFDVDKLPAIDLMRGTNDYLAFPIAVCLADLDLVHAFLDQWTALNLPYQDRTELVSVMAFINPSAPNALKVAQLLHIHGARLNDYASDGCHNMTILQRAVQSGSRALVNFLLSTGADVNAPAEVNIGRTALQAASEQDDEDMVELLLKNGADVDAAPANIRGATAIQFAAMNGNFRIFQILLNAGANLHARRARINGRTALEGAAEHGRLDIVQLSLEQAGGMEGGYFEHQVCRSRELAETRGHSVVADLVHEYQLKRFGTSECLRHEDYFVMQCTRNIDKEALHDLSDYEDYYFDSYQDIDSSSNWSDIASNGSNMSRDDLEDEQIVQDISVANGEGFSSFSADEASSYDRSGGELDQTLCPEGWERGNSVNDQTLSNLWSQIG